MVNIRISSAKANLLGEGRYGSVYAMGDMVLKVYNPFRKKPEEKAKEEYRVAIDLYKAGISVPQPYDIVGVKIDGNKTKGFAMERINGQTVEDFEKICKDSFKINLKKDEVYHEIKKAQNLGFYLSDRHFENAMVRESDEKIFLIDFGRCWSPL